MSSYAIDGPSTTSIWQVKATNFPPPPVIEDPDLRPENSKTGVEISGIIGSLTIAWGGRYAVNGTGAWNGPDCYDRVKR